MRRLRARSEATVRRRSDGTPPGAAILRVPPAAPPVSAIAARRSPPGLGLKEQLLHEIYSAHFEHVWMFLRHLGIHDRDLDDLAQDVFVKFFERLDLFDRRRMVRPWLLGIAYRRMLEYRRSCERDALLGEPGDLRTEGRAPSADQVIAEQQRKQVVELALRELPLERRVVFLMHDLHDQTVPSIAQELSLPLNTAYSRLRVARREFTSAVRRALRKGQDA
jgi:RNA polymerase sigma-70 factor, ECF subfamily